MNFFDKLIDKTLKILEPYDAKKYAYDENKRWYDIGESHIVMQRDMAFELDGIGFNLITSSPIGDSETVVLGNDLNKIKKSGKFARISVIQIDDIQDEQQAYNAIRKIEYVKYHYFPKGYMIRTSSKEQKEVVRVSKKAVKSGINFENVGNLLNYHFKQNKSVKNVKTYFVTLDDFEYKTLEDICDKNSEITNTLNHIMKGINFDCTACSLKPICDEVEGMRELHFKNNSM